MKTIIYFIFTLFIVVNIFFTVTITASKNNNNDNMNGLYHIGNPNLSSKNPYNTEYSKRSDDVEYFDVYSPPVQTRYGEVYWTLMDPVPLSAEIQQKFKNSTIAIVGYEVDQVKKGKDGEADVSVPIYDAYNHHYCAWLLGKDAEMRNVKAANDQARYINHGASAVWIAAPKNNTDNHDEGLNTLPDSFKTTPSSQWFSEGNGGEFRKSYHGYPKKYAQLIKEPTTFTIQPMQIDTHNREYKGPGFKAGPLPKANNAPEGASYSGLLECPCTDRIKKEWRKKYTTQTDKQCNAKITSASECYDAGNSLFSSKNITNQTVKSSNKFPPACSFYDNIVTFNEDATSTVACGASSSSSNMVDSTYSGSTNSTIGVALSLSLDTEKGEVELTISGPSAGWFGIGFNAMAMGDLPYSIIVTGTTVEERKLGNHAPGTQLKNNVKIVTNNVTNGVRTVVLTRPAKGATSDYYTFDVSKGTSINLIVATGYTNTFAYHKGKGSMQINLATKSMQTCVCDGPKQGYIGQTENGPLLPFGKNCLPEPKGDLVQEKNPTCWLDTYVGGLSCCHHKNILLDADQNPWADQIDTYHLKFRFWYESYVPADTNLKKDASHLNLVRMYYQTEAWAGEYDVVQAPKGTPPENTMDEITAHFQVSDIIFGDHGHTLPPNGTTGIKLYYAGGHCHAPSCISLNLYNGDTGELLCSQTPLYGENDKIFNEKGYIAIPPCLWSDGSEDGLLNTFILPLNGNLTSIKRNNNTYNHRGEMASWQMRGVFV